MTHIFELLANPEAAAIFIQEFKAGKISMNWKEILADDDKFEHLEELTFAVMIQAADHATTFNTQELHSIIGKLFTLNRQMETCREAQQTTELAALTKQFEVALREFAALINVKAALESISALETAAAEADEDFDFDSACPLFTLIVRLRMLVNAHEVIDFEQEDGMMFECEDEECETDEAH